MTKPINIKSTPVAETTNNKVEDSVNSSGNSGSVSAGNSGDVLSANPDSVSAGNSGSISAENYDDIINLPRPASFFKPMAMISRAAQFAPFAALGKNH